MSPTTPKPTIGKPLKQINIDYCWFEWQLADGTISDRRAEWAKPAIPNIFAVVLYSRQNRQIIYRENHSHCHIYDAWKILEGGRFGKWKTAALLVILRQALRERSAQLMPLEIPKPGTGQRTLKAWLKLARAYDTVHHGSQTF